MTPHISAKKDQIAETVILPGDPLRAKFIAENYLENYELVSKVRNIFFYTGFYKGKKITVGSSGIGFSSIAIYSYELFRFYDVKQIIRVGSGGSYREDINIFDIILVNQAFSYSSHFSEFLLKTKINRIRGDKELSKKIVACAAKKNIPLQIRNVHSTELFYSHDKKLEEIISETESDAVEMEAYPLFVIAKTLQKQAACVITISDNLITKEEISPKDRETKFKNMIELVLDAII